ncbi:ABC transporter substrate-binding protein [Mesoaciditoga lauensis]|uniref:ABC transporter substrate-binding protein n=1 Tax=Mesoaciditoga lauensis TaxID=1495039 RepID=UPI00068B8E0C|nr:ABC transporter substrate-binding protein [Mesoaciditoga lauensis]
MKKVVVVTLLVFVIGIMAFGSSVKYGGVVNLGGSAPTYVVNNFNPFSPNPDPGVHFVYEPLMYVNPLNGKVTPFLATSYEWSNNGQVLTVTIRQGVKWSDGVPFTPEDVVFTFNLLKKFPALDTNGVWSNLSGLQSVEANGQKVIFKFSHPNIPEYFYILRTLIVPEHIWSKIENPVSFLNSSNPVGTGPFLRETYSVANNTEYFAKNPGYWWKGRPYIDGIRIIGNTSNQAAFLQMIKGETDQNDIAIEMPEKLWVSRDPKTHILFWPVHSDNILYMNDAKEPFKEATFRKAIALAINKRLLEDRAYFGAGGYDISQTQIIPAQKDEWYDPSLAETDKLYNSYNPKKAMELLTSIGYKKNESGILEKDGKALPTFRILVGAGWTDFITMAQIISQELKDIGIQTTIVQQSYNTYLQQLMTGDFDMAIGWPPNTGPTPFYAYYSEFNPSFSAPLGKTAISDYSRYTNSIITEALRTFSSSSDKETQKEAMYKIEKTVLNDLPAIVLTTRTGFDLYNASKFVGWPTISNPYSNGWNGTGLGMLPVVLTLHLR